MPQILAMDFGAKRTGIAVTDDMKIIASGLRTVATEELLDFLKKYLEDHEVELFLVGEPRQMDNSPSESEVLIRPFLKKLSSRFPEIPVERVDERFTSKMAVQSMIESGMGKKKRKEKGLVDEISATLILQSYLYRKDAGSN
jgi:putative Holliday junction resolvase